MGEKKSLTVKVAGKNKTLSCYKTSKKSALNEQAAVLEESNVDAETLTFSNGDSLRPDDRSMSRKKYKPVILSVLSAAVIGVFLGFIMLNVIVDLNNNQSEGDMNAPASTADIDDQAVTREKTTAIFESLHAYVLQGGVFSDKANANEMVDAFAKAGFSSIVWKRDEAYHVFIGISGAKKQMESQIEELNDNGLDVYIKEWKTPEAELQLYEKEYEWLVSIRDQWHTSLKSINDQAGVSWGDWKTLLDNHPETNGSLHEFYRQLEELVTSIEEDADTKDDRHALLKIWHLFEKSVIDV